MNSDDEKLRSIVSKAIHADPLASIVRDVSVESAWDENEDAFLRVSLLIGPHEDDRDTELQSLLSRIEDAVAEIDPRYASVRFLDAA